MNPTERPHVLSASRLSPLYLALLENAYVVHDRLHETDPAALAAVASQVRAIAASGESKVPGTLIAQLPALEIISVMGVGYDGVDVAAAQAHGVMVTHTPDVLDDDVADLAIGLMLCAARQLPQADRYVREGRWLQGPMPLARKLSGARLGLVGIGRIGQAIAARALAFGMTIAYTARHERHELPWPWLPDAAALAARSDFLVVITPGGTGTRHLIDARVLEALGPTGILVNVARGSVVDEAALIDALERGAIGGAALDVFADEPQVPERLRALPQVVLTPHIGSATTATRTAMAELAADNLRLHFAGAPLRTPIPESRRSVRPLRALCRIVVMGVSGSGKSTIGRLIAARLGVAFVEGDELHPARNVALMAAGTPLNDADRAGWLDAIAERIGAARAEDAGLVVACSALKRAYRDRLRAADPALRFVHLHGDGALLRERMARRRDHYMPASLLDSQLRTLEPPDATEDAARFDIDRPGPKLVDGVLGWLVAAEGKR